MDYTQALEILRSSRLAQHADSLEKQLVPSARIVVDDSPPHSTGAAASYFGGLPCLAAGSAWPYFDRTDSLKRQIAYLEDRFAKNPQATGLGNAAARKREELSQAVVPLAFLGQLNLADLSSVVTLPGWPNKGILAFFYSWTQTWGFDPLDRGHCRVSYCPTMQEPAVMPAPDDLPDEARFPQRGIRFIPEWTLPSELKIGPGLSVEWEDLDDLRRQLASTGDDEPIIHRCGGEPEEVQGDMRLECQLVTNGIYCGDASSRNDPRRPALASGATDWQLLLQVDSDEERLGWMWGDAGRVYFWAKQLDIAQHNFDGAWAILQCG